MTRARAGPYHLGNMKNKRPLVLVVLLTAALAAGAQSGRTAPAAPPVLPPGFDALVAKIMKTFDVPGLAVSVVKDGQVVLAKGYGVRRLGEPAPVDARTLFGIASNTKAFTATALGLLVEEGKIEWDGPVTRYLPWFQMWDPYVTREMTVRDLLVHRSGLGLGAGDLLLWPETTYDRGEIVERLRFIKPATSFRSAYAYDNMLYIAAGEVIEAVSGTTWEEFIASRILKRAGLASSEPRHSAELAGRNVAVPHAVLDGKPAPVAIDENDNMNAAGGIISCAEDMARWMLVHLGEGRLPDGTRLFSERTGRELATLVTPIPISEPAPELAAQRTNFNGYALGFRVSDYRGRKLVNHTGGLSGYVSRLVMVPELELGVTVLTNQESSDAYNSVIFAVLDQAMGAPATDWAAAYAKVRERGRSRTREALKAAEEKRDAGAKPSLALEKYAGTYEDAWYGPIVISAEGGGEGAAAGAGLGATAGAGSRAGASARLVMRFSKSPGLVGDMEHWSRETFVARWRDRELRADAYVTFVIDPDGGIVEARMKPVSPDTDFSYDFQDLLLKPAKR